VFVKPIGLWYSDTPEFEAQTAKVIFGGWRAVSFWKLWRGKAV